MTYPYGLIAEFDTAEALIAATRKVRDEGYVNFEAYSPFPIEMDIHPPSRLPWVIFAGGVIGLLTGFFFQVYIEAWHYPLNVGGRPYVSWPNFIPVTFELTILFGAFAAVIGLLAVNGLPHPYHPVFNHPRFDRASQDKFFLVIETADSRFEPDRTRQFLESLQAVEVSDVEM